jgi:hypothetical protein
MFKTARFKIHNPSRHKAAMLRYALQRYHQTLKQLLESALSDPDLLSKVSFTDKKGKSRVSTLQAQKLLYTLAPTGWNLAPLRDYLIGDCAAMLTSHFGKLQRGRHESNPPSLPVLAAPTQEEFDRATQEFTQTIKFPLKPKQEERIEEEMNRGHRRVADRLRRVYTSWATTKAASQTVRKQEAPLPHPIEFTRPEFGRGFLLARKGNNYYLLLRLFSRDSRYWKQTVLENGFHSWPDGEAIGGKKYPGLILPLELGRDFHESEYLRFGSPQSAKLLLKRDEDGSEEYYIHVAFRFAVPPIATSTYMGIDRGAAMIGAAAVVNDSGQLIERLELHGAAFRAQMAAYRKRIAEAQRRGHRRARFFCVRGRKAEIVIGEFANRLIDAAERHKSQIVLEKIDAVAMGRFLTQSQFRKLHAALAYKAARKGLPEPMEGPAARTSQTCSRCGHWARENRPKRDQFGNPLQDVFKCISCGYEANADQNASQIIALRGLHQAQKGGKFRKFDEFQQWLKELVGRDGPPASTASGPVVSSAPVWRCGE